MSDGLPVGLYAVFHNPLSLVSCQFSVQLSELYQNDLAIWILQTVVPKAV